MQLRRNAPRRALRTRRVKRVDDRLLALSIGMAGGPLPKLHRCASATLAWSPKGRAIDVHVIPGRTSQRALVVGGVHGSEPIGVEVTRCLVDALYRGRGRDPRPFFTTIVVPVLFPDNLPSLHGGEGAGRRATLGRVDPNRQFPAIGTGLDTHSAGETRAARDAQARAIERANIALIELITRSRPRRIASVHAIRRPQSAGIYADPDRDVGTPLGEEAADLALRMLEIARAGGARLPRRAHGSGRYPHQHEVRREGVSLGQWASSAVKTGAYRRSAVPVITLELKRDWATRDVRPRQRYVMGIVRAIRRGFLEP